MSGDDHSGVPTPICELVSKGTKEEASELTPARKKNPATIGGSADGYSQALREIVEGTASETGSGFFDALVKHLARAIGTKCAWVTEWHPEQRS